ncbi:MAG: hypothetical protein WD226_08805 [Planctomycetota bacterium]
MARDEALLEHGGSSAVLRLYTWRPDALSLGYFQRFRDVPAAAGATSVVRRWTGGGAIHHADELTFAIAAPLEHALYAGPVVDSYRRVHALVIEALALVGVTARLRGDVAPLASDRAGSGMCFHASTPEDIVWDAAKGVGSAQRRRGGRVLHHGSIKLDTTALEGPIATAKVDVARLETALLTVFGRRFRLVADELTPRERRHAADRAAFFRSDAFVHRR